jgi:NAD(P)-dependent dehydrogenase (short-subunit alcohol dehydrogenase family)
LRIAFCPQTPAVLISGRAQLAVSRGIAESVSRTGVTVNAVLPGPTRSEGVIEFLEKIARERGMDVKQAVTEVIKTLRPTSLIKRMATPEEVANLVVYLCGEGASATTGAALRVDGGVVRALSPDLGSLGAETRLRGYRL